MFTLNCKGQLKVFRAPVVMGILNITPDSFFDESRIGSSAIEELLRRADAMIKDGAAILDIGGQSTRPGSQRISSSEEIERIQPAIKALHQKFPDLIISVDTYDAEVAVAAIEAGASIVNDISGGMMDPRILSVAASYNTPFICTHMQGTPDTMQQNPHYQNLCGEILDYFSERTETCLRAGIKDIILDPGFGFGKTHAHNFEIVDKLDLFAMTGKPILLGVSRKGTIYKSLHTDAGGALNGTTVLNTIGLRNGASILRVHDVKEAMQAIRLTELIKTTNPSLSGRV